MSLNVSIANFWIEIFYEYKIYVKLSIKAQIKPLVATTPELDWL